MPSNGVPSDGVPSGGATSDEDGLAAALDLVGQRWALLIVRSLLDGAKRYGDLQRELGAPTNILATRLRELGAAGILYRVPLAHNVRAYALTERGAALRESIETLARWGEQGRH
jgi:DNA-binding HxlR family transcriptional regulator